MMRAAVIGVGAMGHNHARVYHEIPDVELVAVADLDPTLVAETARLYGARAYADYQSMLTEIQPTVVSVVVPTQAHCRVAVDALDAGWTDWARSPNL